MDYLATRREEIETQMRALRNELNEIRIAEAALSGAPSGRTVMIGARGPTFVRDGTIKDWVMRALSSFENGLETDSVIEAIRKMGGPFVERSSITPQLSRLKAAGLIGQNGRLWRLPTEEDKAQHLDLHRRFSVAVLGQKNETPDGGTSGASDEEAV
ncbi:MAG: hypothetical protein KKE02_23800 [Alphaproteobacteria bacterium]|nr:hypothetical protein [Alphaproteobacteria bacterium]MBU1514923.1 hypothetical protein [Alphaproteobacteria bacterium]MBU2094965.1 hypothetical protein [Alphaproteobacteria bacterium]MBU2154062.1 hypothetical protein [Alphaproteobacteria bacterium]MBU2305425.1 hypothetical protein [Alphaproteobacteria bacterium]